VFNGNAEVATVSYKGRFMKDDEEVGQFFEEMMIKVMRP
jgi:hypothetical protein